MKHENLVYQRICSDEGLTLETSAFQSLYGGQFTLSTPLVKRKFRPFAALTVASSKKYILRHFQKLKSLGKV